MAQADWTVANDSLDTATVRRGVTAGIARPSGGGSFLYGMNSIAIASGAVALFVNLANFAPMAKGGIVRGAIKRGVSGAPSNFSPFLFIGLQGPSVNDNAYLLGLADEEPSRIVLRKGKLSDGIPAAAPGSLGVLRRSTQSYAVDTWLHLMLMMVYNTNGDVVLQCFQSDLGAHAVTAPSWAAIPGMDAFTDDALGVNSGSVPYTSGRVGFGGAFKDVTRRMYFDHIAPERQL